jgi:hypothetical protein
MLQNVPSVKERGRRTGTVTCSLSFYIDGKATGYHSSNGGWSGHLDQIQPQRTHCARRSVITNPQLSTMLRAASGVINLYQGNPEQRQPPPSTWAVKYSSLNMTTKVR